ncbi:MAG: hypothetical protein U1E73_11535 [Planctomycetota bacterium]
MRTSSRLILIAAALLLCVLLYPRGEPDAPDRRSANDAVETVPPVPAAVDGAGNERSEVEVAPTAPAEAPANGFEAIPAHASIERVTVRGRVVDLSDLPIAGIAVVRGLPGLKLGAASVPTDDTGHFEFEAALPVVVAVRDETYATVLEGFAATKGVEPLVVVARRIPLGGVVVDEAGAAIADAEIAVAAEAQRAGRDQGASRSVVQQARSDAAGTFRIDDAAAVPGARMGVRAAGFVLLDLAVPQGGDPAMRVVLQRFADRVTLIRGRVVRDDGRPVAKALVSTGVLASPTDADGFFVIDFEPWLRYRVDESAPTVLTAVAAGMLPATRTLPSVQEARTKGWPADIVMRLDGAPRSITGIVVDENGAPLRDVLVEPDDMTAFGIVPSPEFPGFGGVPRTAEQLAGGGECHTDADGRFRLDGLLARDYRLRTLLRPSLLSSVSEPIAAGSTDVWLVLDRRQLGTIAGRIVDRHGEGIGGVRVSVSGKRVTELVIGKSATTAADGSFAIADATTAPAFLRIEGAAIVPELFRELLPSDDVAALTLPVGRRCRVQFEWGQQQPADRVSVEDATGESLMMMRLGGGSIGEAPYIAYTKEISEVLVVSDAAQFAIVRRGDDEILRVRLALTAEGVHVIRL